MGRDAGVGRRGRDLSDDGRLLAWIVNEDGSPASTPATATGEDPPARAAGRSVSASDRFRPHDAPKDGRKIASPLTTPPARRSTSSTSGAAAATRDHRLFGGIAEVDLIEPSWSASRPSTAGRFPPSSTGRGVRGRSASCSRSTAGRRRRSGRLLRRSTSTGRAGASACSPPTSAAPPATARPTSN